MKIIASILVVCAIAISSVAQSAAPADISSHIDQLVTKSMQAQQIPGMTVSAAMNGRMVYSKAFGRADLENSVPASTETLIRTGSIAKPISAVAAMTLFDSGKLDLDAPVQKYCPAFPVKQWPVTTRQVLSHTAGIRHYKGEEFASTRHFTNMADGIALFGSEPLLFEPGTDYSYSTHGYTVIGCVIEGASGEKFADYVAQHVLKPAGMAHTIVDDVFDIVPHRARGYQKTNGKVQNAGLMDSSYKIPGGGYVTTADDLVRFGQALLDGKIVKPETLQMMWTAAKLKSDAKTSTYGLGFGVAMVDGEKYVSHTGSQQGTTTSMVIIPGKHFSAAALANMDSVNVGESMRGLLEEFKMPYPKPVKK